MNLLIFIATVVFSIPFARIISITIHELGHGIVASFFSPGKIDIYLGSHGNAVESSRLRIGRFNIYLSTDTNNFNGGLCVPEKQITAFLPAFLFVLAGPFSSLFSAGIFAYLILFLPIEIDWVILIVLIILTLNFIFDFFFNIIPRKKSIALSDGYITYNDGQLLKILWKGRAFFKEIALLNQSIIDKKPQKGISQFQGIYKNYKDPNILRVGISLYTEMHQYEKVKILFEDLSKLDELNDQDYGTYGLNYSYEEDHKKALELYDKSLELNSKNFYSTLNRGYTYNLLEKYSEALEDFNNAIALNSNSAYCYSNRGLSKIKIGDEKGGLEDINKAISIDKNESYAYKNLGLYYFEKGMLEKALELLSKAKQLNEKTNGIDELISKVEENLNVGSK